MDDSVHDSTRATDGKGSSSCSMNHDVEYRSEGGRCRYVVRLVEPLRKTCPARWILVYVTAFAVLAQSCLKQERRLRYTPHTQAFMASQEQAM